jgi:hypothetical protein
MDMNSREGNPDMDRTCDEDEEASGGQINLHRGNSVNEFIVLFTLSCPAL